MTIHQTEICYNFINCSGAHMYNEIKESMRIRLGGSDEIEIETLNSVLTSTINILREATDELIEKDGYRKFLVTNVTKGSFIIDISTLYQQLPNLLPYVPSVLSTIKTCLEIKAHLGGKKPNEIERSAGGVSIVNSNNSTITVNEYHFDIYTSKPDLDKNITKIMKALDGDSERTTLEIELNDGVDSEKSIKLEPNEISNLTTGVDFGDTLKDIVTQDMEAWISLKKIDLDGRSQWEIYINAQKETASISDELFLSQVKNGQYQFSSHTRLKVRMTVRFKTDKNRQPIAGQRVYYDIFKVIEINSI